MVDEMIQGKPGVSSHLATGLGWTVPWTDTLDLVLGSKRKQQGTNGCTRDGENGGLTSERSQIAGTGRLSWE